MIAEIIFIETAPASYLHPFALISFVSGFGGTRREDLRYYIEQKWKEKRDELIQQQGIDDFCEWLYCKFINCNYGKKEGTAAANESRASHHRIAAPYVIYDHHEKPEEQPQSKSIDADQTSNFTTSKMENSNEKTQASTNEVKNE